LLILSGISGFGQRSHRQLPKNQPAAKTLTPQEIARRTMAALVSIETFLADQQTPLGYGSGFCVGQDPLIPRNALIATNYHVLKGCGALSIRAVPSRKGSKPTDEQYIRFIDEFHDIALLSVEIKRAPLSLALTLPTTGDAVYVMGNPETFEASFSSGMVSAVRPVPFPWIQITAPISPGSSGGPVVNSLGQVIGIASASFSEGQNLNRAVPSTLINAAIAALNADPERTTDQAMDVMIRDQIPSQDKGPAAAPDTAPAPAPTPTTLASKIRGWTPIGETVNGVQLYYLKSSIKERSLGLRQMWVLVNITRPGEEDLYMNLVRVDCTARQFTAIRAYRPGGKAEDVFEDWQKPKVPLLVDVACK
jgi:S1-C subfamily serine protease